MDVRELITSAEHCRRLAMACNDETLAREFQLLANEYLDQVRQTGIRTTMRRSHRRPRQRMSECARRRVETWLASPALPETKCAVLHFGRGRISAPDRLMAGTLCVKTRFALWPGHNGE
jgi:hypothetical protein